MQVFLAVCSSFLLSEYTSLVTLLKIDFGQVFPVNCVKVLRTTFFYNSSGVCFCVLEMKVLELVEASTLGLQL